MNNIGCLVIVSSYNFKAKATFPPKTPLEDQPSLTSSRFTLLHEPEDTFYALVLERSVLIH
jgi:hypothetical protein